MRRVSMMVSSIALVFAGPVSTLAEDAAQRPNIILCMADDQGWGDMAYNGNPVVKTPNFDAMAKAGLRFDRFYAAAPVCSPTRGSVMTGRHPNRYGVFKWGHPIRPQEITIAEALKTAGYATGHFGKWHLGSVRKQSPVNPGANGFDVWFSAPNFFDNDPILSAQGKAVPVQGESSMVTVDRALQFIERCSRAEKPFLAVVWFGSPHNPHIALDEDKALYPGESKARQNFLGEITAMDRAFGKLRDALGPLGIRENTILWYTSDNGALGVGSTGGHRGKKGSIYEGGLLVPALLEWPAVVKRPRPIAARCNSSDIYPTLLEITGVEVEGQPRLDGISLVDTIGGAAQPRHAGMGFWDYPAGGISTPSAKWMAELLAAQKAGREPGNKERLHLAAGEIAKKYDSKQLPGHAAWIAGDWKLHRIAPKNGKPRYELYNLANDPAEKKDVISGENERVDQLKAALANWQTSVMASLNGEDYP